MRSLLTLLLLAAAMLPAFGHAQAVNICDRTPQVRDIILWELGLSDCAAVDSKKLAAMANLDLGHVYQLTSLRARDLDGLAGLTLLSIDNNPRLATLSAGVFDNLTRLEWLHLNDNQLTALPAGVFDNLTRLEGLRLNDNQLTALPAGVFDNLTRLEWLWLDNNQLTALPAGVFDNLTRLADLHLNGNQLATLPAGVFDNLTRLVWLRLNDNQLTALPAGVFDNLARMERLWLGGNHLVGLSVNDPLFARLPRRHLDGVFLGRQTNPPEATTRMNAAVPLLASASNSMRQGFVRIINKSNQSGSVRILAYDDGGTAANPVEIQLGANRAIHFNAEDLEDGNANKGINAGMGSPVQGDWRLDIETALNVRVLSFIRTNDGFLTSMGEVLQRTAQGRLAVQFFNPASNTDRVSKLRLVNTGANAASVSIQGVDDRGNASGTVRLRLNAGEARTLSAQDLETGAQGLTGTLGDGAGKWRLFIGTGEAVVGVSLLDAASGHLTNLSTMGVDAPETPATTATRMNAAVPLLVSASNSMRQGFVRIINESNQAGSVRILAHDDGGTAANPIEIRLEANRALHFNSGDLEDGNANKGINAGLGSPGQGDWRLDIETALNVRVLSFIRTNDGFLTSMGEVLPRNAQGRLAVQFFNPASNTDRVSKLRLVNTEAHAESVSIQGVDDRGRSAGPVSLALAANEARTLTAQDLEDGAQGLTGTLGDGAGKWRLFIGAGEAVVGVSLLDAASGHLTNMSTGGIAAEGQ